MPEHDLTKLDFKPIGTYTNGNGKMEVSVAIDDKHIYIMESPVSRGAVGDEVTIYPIALREEFIKALQDE